MSWNFGILPKNRMNNRMNTDEFRKVDSIVNLIHEVIGQNPLDAKSEKNTEPVEVTITLANTKLNDKQSEFWLDGLTERIDEHVN